jgi:hypothetical protein|tara:strand:+ start:4015 stop:4215 length:201 start_codon:yes stop_codon:yes gene_type:complete
MSFLNTLKPEEHRMLRQMVRDIHFQYFDEKHGASFITNKMLDNIIEVQGREAIEKLLKAGIDKGLR